MDSVDDLGTQVLAYAREYRLFAQSRAVVVAVSGGADSLCLLYLLYDLMPVLSLELHVAHLDHALRPEGAADAAFVAHHAARLGLPCTVERRDVALSPRRRGQGLEAAARAERYAFLREVAAAWQGYGQANVDGDKDTPVIATGHTRDDQAETLLLHLARGSGLAGAAGMQPRRGDVVRPLLDTARGATEAYCAARGLVARRDESNASLVHARNRVRHEVLPALEATYPGARANLARAARLLGADLALVERLATASLDAALLAPVERGTQEAMLSVERWVGSEPELRPHMLRVLFGRLRGTADGVEERHYSMVDAVFGSSTAVPPRVRLDLPHGLAVQRRGSVVTIGPRRGRGDSLAGSTAAPEIIVPRVLTIPGRVATAAGVIDAACMDAPWTWDGVPAHVAYLDRSAVGPALVVRSWHAGDRVQPLGLDGTRKVQDVFVDLKVPRDVRGSVPIVVGPHGIAWVAGACTGQPYSATRGAPAVRLTWERETAQDRQPGAGTSIDPGSAASNG